MRLILEGRVLHFTGYKALTALLIISLIPSLTLTQSLNRNHTFIIEERDGVRHTVSGGGPKFEGELFTYQQILILQENPAYEESLLFRPSEFTTDSNGQYLVVDQGNYRIAVFNAQGEYSHSFGQRGQGPGEFETIRIQGVHEDVISLFDAIQQRATRFRTDGTLLEVIKHPRPRGRLSSLVRLDNGDLVALGNIQPRTETYASWQAQVEIVNDDGSKIAAIDSTPVIISKFSAFVGLPGGGSVRRSASIPFVSRPEAVFHNALGILITDGMEPTIDVYSKSGTLQQRIHLNSDPTPVSRQERRQIQAEYQRRIDNQTGTEQLILRREFEALEFPAHKAFWTGMYIDDSGYIWLQEPSILGIVPQMHDTNLKIFSPDGEYLGTTEWPPSIRHPVQLYAHVSYGKLMVRVRDEESGQSKLTVYQIVPAVTGLDYPTSKE